MATSTNSFTNLRRASSLYLDEKWSSPIECLPDKKTCELEVEQYLSACIKYKMDPDPAVIITLRGGWKQLEIRDRCSEGCLLPLVEILKNNKTVDSLVLIPKHRPPRNEGNANARLLTEILSENVNISNLVLSMNSMGSQGVHELACSIATNTHLKSLCLSYNDFGVKGALSLSKALSQNKSLERLDVSHNHLGFRCISELRSASQEKVNFTFVGDAGNYVLEEVLNGVTHGIGVLASIIGSIVLMSHANQTSFFLLPRVAHVLQIMDHCCIYALIAGTYTPLCLVRLGRTGAVIVAIEWILALFGVMLSMHVVNSKGKARFAGILELLLYIFMGCAMAFNWNDERLADTMPLVLAGGAAYLFGVIAYLLEAVHPLFHPIWHLFVMAGSAVHYFAILFYIAWAETPFHMVQSLLGFDCNSLKLDTEKLLSVLQNSMGCSNPDFKIA